MDYEARGGSASVSGIVVVLGIVVAVIGGVLCAYVERLRQVLGALA